MTGEAGGESRAKELLARIVQNQSGEGWFREYEGADPGYQSLCTYYLADVHLLRPGWGLSDALARSIRFLWYFAHPDGSFGGLYGSRCTRFYYPAGMEALSLEIPESAALAKFMASSIVTGRVVTLMAMDEPNLVPMFNAYCWAATLWEVQHPVAPLPTLPARRGKNLRVSFPEAGLLVDAGPSHYTIVSTHKGGVVAHFLDERVVVLDAGVVVRNPAGLLGSSQAFAPENRVQLDGDTLTVEATISPMPKKLPTPSQFLVLRLLCFSAFRVRLLREKIKQLLVSLLITRRQLWPARNIRCIDLGVELTVSDKLEARNGYTRLEVLPDFVAIHMASQGYWQIQDEEVKQ